MATGININKSINPKKKPSLESGRQTQEMELYIKRFFSNLDQPYSVFDPESAFKDLLEYITKYDRVLYSVISNIIYAHYEKNQASEPIGSILTNLDALLKFSENLNKNEDNKKTLFKDSKKEDIERTQKVVIKMWDHVTLANQQYTILKQSDSEYDEKFKKRISSYKEEMTKEINIQMITMVGIFTALAFLIFGSISSLDGVFENLKLPLFKVMSVGLIWGICISNMIFVFLYCIGKMTKLNFKSNNSINANIFQKYPIVWWTNLILISLLTITSWGYFVQHTITKNCLIGYFNDHPLIFFTIGTLFVLAIIITACFFLCKKTLPTKK